MGVEKNPFTILGLDRDFVATLSIAELERVIEFTYRGLQGIFHPDKPTANKEKSAALNWAKGQLDDPVLRMEWKKYYLGRVRRKRLLEEVVSLEETNKSYVENYLFPTLTTLFKEAKQGRHPDFLGIAKQPLIVRRLPKGGLNETLSQEIQVWQKSRKKGIENLNQEKEIQKEKGAYRLRYEGQCLVQTRYGQDPVPFPRLPIGVITLNTMHRFSDGKNHNPTRFIANLYRNFRPSKTQGRLVSSEGLSRAEILTSIPAKIFTPVLGFLTLGPMTDFPFLITVSAEDQLTFHLEGSVHLK